MFNTDEHGTVYQGTRHGSVPTTTGTLTVDYTIYYYCYYNYHYRVLLVQRSTTTTTTTSRTVPDFGRATVGATVRRTVPVHILVPSGYRYSYSGTRYGVYYEVRVRVLRSTSTVPYVRYRARYRYTYHKQSYECTARALARAPTERGQCATQQVSDRRERERERTIRLRRGAYEEFTRSSRPAQNW